MRLNYIDNIDCLEGMKNIPDGSVDMVLCDLPYGTTACKWDTAIPFEPLWEHYNRVIKNDGAIVLFAGEPFASYLRTSNIRGFKYDLVWKKSKSGSAFTAKYRPVNKHEMICVFSKGGGKTKYNPQKTKGAPYKRTHKISEVDVNNHKIGFNRKEVISINEGYRYPITILDFPQKWRRQDQVHPTQKPVALLEYLVRTYTNEGDTVLDNCIGSGSTAVACIHTGRNFIGFESSADYCRIAQQRIDEAYNELVKEVTTCPSSSKKI